MQNSDFPNPPKSWQVKTLGEVCDIISKGATPKIQNKIADKNSALFLKAENVTKNGCVNFDNVKFIDYKTHTTTLKRSMLKNLDILITIAGSLARCAVLEIKPNQQININQAVSFARLKDTSKVNPYFVKYFIMNPTMQLYLLSKAKTTAVPNLTLEIIRDTKIPIPPLEIQRRIVKRLDEAFSRIESGTKHLKSAKDNLTKYKQSLLKSAFNGTLTQDCPLSLGKSIAESSLRGSEATEAIHKIDCHESLRDSRNDDFPNLPKSWQVKTFKEVMFVKDGTHESPKYLSKGYPFVTSKNLKNNTISFDNIKYISKQDYDKFNERSKVEIGDVLFAMIGTIGNPVVITQEVNFAIKNVALFKKSNSILPMFLKYYLETGFVMGKMQKESRGSTQKFVSLEYLRNFKIPIPPLEIQKQIVAILERHFTSADKVSAYIDSCLSKAKQLKSSLLKSAFAGELV